VVPCRKQLNDPRLLIDDLPDIAIPTLVLIHSTSDQSVGTLEQSSCALAQNFVPVGSHVERASSETSSSKQDALCDPECSDPFDDEEPLDTASTWRMVLLECRNVPSDIGELAYKDIHSEIARRVLDRLREDGSRPSAYVVAGLGAQILYDTWERRQLGRVPRNPDAWGIIMDLLVDDVHRGAAKLSNSAMEALGKHMKASLRHDM
jgi:hypothetical protein